jgi:hypothetical protein
MNLNTLFRDCNSEYYDDYLDEVAEIKWTSRLGSALGRTNLEVNENGFAIRILINDAIREDALQLKRVMAHESIHVWQYQQYLKTGYEIYLDLNPEFPALNGHGPYFDDISSQLNHLFPELKISISDDALVSDYAPSGLFTYLDVGFTKNGEERRAIFHAPGKSELDMTDIRSGLEAIYGKEDLNHIRLNTTTDPVITCFGSLTNRNKFFKRQPPIYFKDDDLLLLRGIDVKSIVNIGYAPTKPKPFDFNDILKTYGRYGHLSFMEFLDHVVSTDDRVGGFRKENVRASFSALLLGDSQQELKEIHKAWMSVGVSAITKTVAFHDFIEKIPLATSVEVLSNEIVGVVKDFGWRRVDRLGFIPLLRDELGEFLSETSITEMLLDLGPKISNPRYFDGHRVAKKLISEPLGDYVLGNIVERLSDGYVLRVGFMDDLTQEWTSPQAGSIAKSLLIEKSVEKFMETALPAFLSKSPIEMSRKVDIIIAGWGGIISRGVSPAALRSAFVEGVRSVSEHGKSRRSQRSWEQDVSFSDLISSLSGIVDASLNHCFAVGHRDFRVRRDSDQNQMGLFK